MYIKIELLCENYTVKLSYVNIYIFSFNVEYFSILVYYYGDNFGYLRENIL